MVFASWRGVVGCVKPTHRPGSLEEFIRLLPEGIGVVPVYLDFRRGTEDEFRAALNAVHEKVAELAKEGVDLIHPEGAPPFMVQGIRAKRRSSNSGRRNSKRLSSLRRRPRSRHYTRSASKNSWASLISPAASMTCSHAIFEKPVSKCWRWTGWKLPSPTWGAWLRRRSTRIRTGHS